MEVALEIVTQIGSVVLDELPYILVCGVLFGALSLVPNQSCNPSWTWWKSRDLILDIFYCFFTALTTPYLRIGGIVLLMLVLHGKVTPEHVATYFNDGEGLVSHQPFWFQAVFYLLGYDLLQYISHRLFHGRNLWPFHAVHHSAEELDWTATFRVHPVNRLFGAVTSNLIMLGLGVPPSVMVMLAPFDALSAAWVHSNLNWTLGPLKYIIATPVFHRWHHTGVEEGGERNFASTFSFIDVIFGTFYMPEGVLPETYGVDDKNFPKDFIGQMLVPFIMFVQSFRGDDKRADDAVTRLQPVNTPSSDKVTLLKE